MAKLRAFLKNCVATPFNIVLSILTVIAARLARARPYRVGADRCCLARQLATGLRRPRRRLLGVHPPALRTTSVWPLSNARTLARRCRSGARGRRHRGRADADASCRRAQAHRPYRALPAAVRRGAAPRRGLRRPQGRADHRLGRHHAHHRDRRVDDRDLPFPSAFCWRWAAVPNCRLSPTRARPSSNCGAACR